MRVTIHQPEHIPWLGFFHKVNLADVYVVLDNVQYRRRYFQNRNKIRTKDGWQWLVVPLVKEERDELLIKDAKLSIEARKRREDNLQTIYCNYSKANFFKEYWEEFKNIYGGDYIFLSDLNTALLKFFFAKLGIRARIIFASTLGLKESKGDLMLEICRKLGASLYVSGVSGRDYLDFQKFKDNAIEVAIQEFHHPIYRQIFEPFIPCLSVLDLLFNCGDRSLEIINGINTAVMEQVFL